MSLTLILGRAGSGKTGCILERIRQITQGDRGREVTLLVPDQYTVAAERYFLDRLGEETCRRVRILSLKRLASTLSARYTPATAPPLGDGGKAVLLKKAVDAVSAQFRFYPPNFRDFSFVRRLQQTVRELKAGGTSADALMEIARIENNDRLYDISMIYQAYEGFLAGEFSDPDDSLGALCALLKDRGLFEGEEVFADNFHGFYAEERNVLVQLCRNGAHVTVTLPAPSLKDEEMGYGALSGPTEEAARLAGQVKRFGGTVEVVCLPGRREGNLARLEQSLFAPKVTPREGIPEEIEIYRAADRFDEADRAAAEITRLVRDEGWHYRDFVVMVRNLEEYDGVLDAVFSRYGIPLFFHRRTPLREKNPIPLLLALLDIVTGGYTPQAVMTFLKSGFGDYESEDVARFEHYVDRWGIRYNRFLQEFRQSVRGFEEEREEDRQRLARLNALRADFTGRVEAFREATRGQTLRQVTAEVFLFLCGMNVEQTLDRLAEEYAACGETELAARQKEAYGLLLDALDELVAAAGDETVSMEEYRELLLAVLDTKSIAILPTSLDETVAGSPETMPLLAPAGVFVLGLSEGVFPRPVTDEGLLEDGDREILEKYGAEGGDTAEEKLLRERFYLYTAFCAPQKKLWLSWPSAGGQGRPSAGILQVYRLFPALKYAPAPTAADRIQNEAAAFLMTSAHPVRELEDYFRTHPDYAPLYGREDEAPTPPRLERLRQRVPLLRPETALALFGEDMNISSTKANDYHLCPYAYFARYGLKLKTFRRAELDPLSTGTLIHGALEYCMSRGMDCSDRELEARVEEYGRGWLRRVWRDRPPDSFLSYFHAILGKIQRMLSYFKEELAASEFVPVGFEVSISAREGAVPPVRIPLSRGEIYMAGTVDRMDLLEKNGVKYLRVIDYKSKAKKFDLRLVQEGIDMQMLMYLCALRQNAFPGESASVVPAGVMYVNASPKTVLVKRKDLADGKATQELQSSRSGLFLNDPDILRAMDPTPDRRYICVKDSDRALVTQERFGKLFEDIQTLLSRMGEALHQGQIPRRPVIGCDKDSCQFCDLRRTCKMPEKIHIPTTKEGDA